MTLLFLTLMTLLLHFGMGGAVTKKPATKHEVVVARLGEPLSLNCTYECSTGFIRGEWKWDDTACHDCRWVTADLPKKGDMCIVNLYARNLTWEQTQPTYSCISVKNDHRDLPHNIELQVTLQTEDWTAIPVTVYNENLDGTLKVDVYINQQGHVDNYSFLEPPLHIISVPVGTQLKLKCLFTNEHCEGQWMKENLNLTKGSTSTLIEWDKITEEDGGRYLCHINQPCSRQMITVEIGVNSNDELGWIKVLAAVALSAAAVLILFLIYLCYKRRGSVVEAEDSSNVIYENTRVKHAETVYKPIVQDCPSDHEVPYADIVISVRGSSIPELTGIQSQASREHRLRWKDEAVGGSHLQACRSADRLHVHPKEVSRKLSTNSEYAIITYSTEALS